MALFHERESNRGKILILDDDPEMLENCHRILRRSGYHCVMLNQSGNFSQVMRAEQPDLVLTDLKMPEKDGIQILKEAKQIDSDVVVILFTAYGTIKSAVEACRLGAFDYIQKPFSAEQLRVSVERGIRQKRLSDENKFLRSQLKETFSFRQLVGNSPPFTKVLELVRKVADTEANILIQGESGTGKELIARSIHANSSRSNRPFVPVDCASLPETLLESELFGHEKGAFTGAHVARPGIFELAHGGTLFFDEIGELGLELQSKLLRALQEGQIRRLGGRKLVETNARIISATNQDLDQAVKEGRFRKDLFYRINVITVKLPPLRERKEDIPLLLNHYLRHFGRRSKTGVNKISKKAMELLERYEWPGNVRELQNVVERAVCLATSDTITPKELPDQVKELGGQSPSISSFMELDYKAAKKHYLELFEREYLSELLKKYQGNISRAANEAGINRKTIHRLLRRHGISPLEFKKV